MEQPSVISRPADQVRLNAFVQGVYNWMFAGLAITGACAWAVSSMTPLRRFFMGNAIVPIILFIATLGLVVALSARIQKMQASTATGLFLLYSGLMGVMISSIFLVYTTASIASTFLVCAAMFGAVSLYGWKTQRNLMGMGSFLFMGLVGIILASVANWFLGSPMLQWIISYAGVGLFLGLTAYDTQRIKHMAETQPADVGPSAVRKASILGALSLYLDFINLFLFLLQILGQSRD
ncbi:MAG: Bax inhibitor-1/YccA family protein [Deltaproteobacteria bacterium]|nr:Bax inhibitor-1/YccA family protein [Deltaproteobacteria bacterium]